MQPIENRNAFFVWGADQAAYGPVELPTLIAWVNDERVLANTWIHVNEDASWRQAADIAELQAFFRPSPSAALSGADISPAVLRRFKVLACLNDDQLAGFSKFLQSERFQQGAVVVKQGDHGDAMHLILSGDLRVSTQADGRESTLATLGPGDYFGDIALFDPSPRSADVVANVDSVVLKLTATGFERLARQSPDLAAPFLLSTIRTLVARIRADNKRLRDTVNLSRAAGR